MRTIPAMDLMNGELVRLYKGQFDAIRRYDFTPEDYAKRLKVAGFTHIHLVDLEGARSGAFREWDTINTLSTMGFKVDVGGGLRSRELVERAFASGASQVNLGTVWFKAPALVDDWIKQFGPEAFILGLDLNNGVPAISGWKDQVATDWRDVLKDACDRGIRYVSCTSIQHDGTGTGPDMELYRKIMESFPEIELIASGGIGNRSDLNKLLDIKLCGIIVGKALMEPGVELDSYISC